MRPVRFIPVLAGLLALMFLSGRFLQQSRQVGPPPLVLKPFPKPPAVEPRSVPQPWSAVPSPFGAQADPFPPQIASESKPPNSHENPPDFEELVPEPVPGSLLSQATYDHTERTDTPPGPLKEQPDRESPKALSTEQLVDLRVSETDGGTRVELLADDGIADHDSFALTDAPRIVMDLWGVSHALPESNISVGSKELARIRIGRHPGKVRVVFDLEESPGGFPGYKIEKEGKSMLIVSLVRKTPPRDTRASPGPTESVNRLSVPPAEMIEAQRGEAGTREAGPSEVQASTTVAVAETRQTAVQHQPTTAVPESEPYLGLLGKLLGGKTMTPEELSSIRPSD